MQLTGCSSTHSRNRRQAVTPEQPICRGTIRYGTLVISTNTIAVNAVRSLTRGRPVRRGVRSGNNDFTSSHSPSSTSSDLAIKYLSARGQVLRFQLGRR
jgi:hypothetical protein